MNNICVLCSSNCSFCNSTNANMCTGCQVGYYLNITNSMCYPISTLVSSSNTCSYGCQSCVSVNGAMTCSLCYLGFTFNANGYCTPCIAGCAICINTNYNLCITCSSGFYLTSNSLCQACSANCVSCSMFGCNNCGYYYYVTSNFTCLPNCQYPCATCNLPSTSKCTSCIFGYTFNNTSLQNCNSNIQSCNSNSNCTYCGYGYVLVAYTSSIKINQTCLACGTSCLRCTPTNINNCTVCYQGFYLSNNTCAMCPTGC